MLKAEQVKRQLVGNRPVSRFAQLAVLEALSRYNDSQIQLLAMATGLSVRSVRLALRALQLTGRQAA